jgi:hypothetical protein
VKARDYKWRSRVYKGLQSAEGAAADVPGTPEDENAPVRASESVREPGRYRCRPWNGRPADYQDRASAVLYDNDHKITPLMWIVPICETPYCLNDQHLQRFAPRRILYPYGLCVYCGLTATGRDHLLPRAWSGDRARLFVATVPCCPECNGLLGAKCGPNVTERREFVHEALSRKHASTLRTPDYTLEQINEFEGGMRIFVRAAIARKRDLRERLDWPTDIGYDLRAFQKSGIDDPYELGLLGEAEAA